MARNEYDIGDSRLSLHQQIGYSAEVEVMEYFQQIGYNVTHVSGEKWDESMDLRVDGKPIEVKKAYPTDRQAATSTKRWQFNLSSIRQKMQHSDYYIVLLAIDENGQSFWFFVHSSEVTGTTIQLTSHPLSYGGKYAPFLFDNESIETWLNS